MLRLSGQNRALSRRGPAGAETMPPVNQALAIHLVCDDSGIS